MTEPKQWHTTLTIEDVARADEREWVKLAILCHDHGMRPQHIANSLGVTRYHVCRALFPEQIKQRHYASLYRHHCSRCSTVISTASRMDICRPCRRAEKIFVLQCLWEAGLTTQTIAELLHTTSGSIRVTMTRLRQQGFAFSSRSTAVRSLRP